jgi:hypothetical protein
MDKDNRRQGWPFVIGLIIAGIAALLLAFQPSFFLRLGFLPLQSFLLLIQGIPVGKVPSHTDIVSLFFQRCLAFDIAVIGIVAIICGCLMSWMKLMK